MFQWINILLFYDFFWFRSSSEELSLTEETIKKRIKKHIFYSDNEDAKDDEDENDSVSTNDTEEDDTNDNVSNGIKFY